MNAVHPLQTSSRRWLPLQSAEWALLVAAAALLAFAVWGPLLPASAHSTTLPISAAGMACPARWTC